MLANFGEQSPAADVPHHRLVFSLIATRLYRWSLAQNRATPPLGDYRSRSRRPTTRQIAGMSGRHAPAPFTGTSVKAPTCRRSRCLALETLLETAALETSQHADIPTISRYVAAIPRLPSRLPAGVYLAQDGHRREDCRYGVPPHVVRTALRTGNTRTSHSKLYISQQVTASHACAYCSENAAPAPLSGQIPSQPLARSVASLPVLAAWQSWQVLEKLLSSSAPPFHSGTR